MIDAQVDLRILVADDEQPNVDLMAALLRRTGYRNVTTTTSSTRLLELLREAPADLVLLDLHMPAPDGFAVLERIAGSVPVLVLTADATRETRDRALDLGASDFLTKPIDLAEARLRIRNLLSTRVAQLGLEAAVRARTAELETARIELLDRLALAAEFRDQETGEHTRRVGEGSARIAERLDRPAWWVELVRRGAPLHDIGKLGVRDAILLKPGRLDDLEHAAMQEHAEMGARILSGSEAPVLQLAEEIALTHHERWDGEGYPRRLAGEAIPLSGRIVAVVDVFDALTHARPYKEAWPVDRALATVEEGAGAQFDPQVVEAFLALQAG